MSNLKQDLDEYLLLQSDQKKNFNVKLPQLKVPSGLSQIFSRSDETPEANSWLKDTQDSCCPKLVNLQQLLIYIILYIFIAFSTYQQSRLQRIVGFVACLGMGCLCMTLSTLYIPVLMLKPKFALLFTLGSLFFIISFCFLVGFQTFFRQMFSKPRLLSSISYSGCLITTLYFALVAKSTAFTVLFAVAQIITLLFMLLGMVPGGATGLKFFGQLFKSSVSASSSALPV
ncbi:hypothetical protein KR215_010498 [Drosophila sulfurigaster]|nr:hypothetical protein KR215_010498 [Drosophila sulfurigaster]